MKMNWGTGIALAYATFVFSILGFVFAAQQHDPGLISKNYYDLDLHYQQRMTEKQNAAALREKLTVRVDAASSHLLLQFPIQETGLPVGGHVKMYRSAGTTAGDVVADIRTDANGLMALPVGKLPKGRWHVEATWQAGGRMFYHELALVL